MSPPVLPWRAPAPPVSPVPHRVLESMASGLALALSRDELLWAPGQDRAFVRLLATPAYEAWLIAWAPSGALELHDHGGARGAVHVVRGRLAERYTHGHGHVRLQSRTLPAGSHVAVPAERVHEVWSPGPESALSVHAYAPPLSTMTFFDHGPDGTLRPTRTVHGDVATVDAGSRL